MKDYYKILQVHPKATPQEIKKAYRTLAKKYHPDRNASMDAEIRFKEVSSAYDVLSSPEHRNEFDAQRLAGSLSVSQGSFIKVVSGDCIECCTTGFISIKCNACQSKGYWHEKKPYGKTKVKSKIICTICQGLGKIRCICLRCAGTGKIRKFKK